MNILNRIIFHLHYTKLNIIKTLLINLKTLPLKHAIKFPIFLYGKVDVYHLLGTVEFHNCNITRGMVKLGANKEFLNTVKGPSLIILSIGSRIVFEGSCEISSNFLLRTGKDAELRFGANTFLGSNVKAVCIKKISIGEGSRIGFESQLIDSDFHYTYDINKKVIRPREKEIIIGKYNWIGNRTTISKGCKTGDYTIAASSSILNRDYIDSENPNPLLAGSPAKIIGSKIRRIFSQDTEDKLIEHFRKNEYNKKVPYKIIEDVENELNKL